VVPPLKLDVEEQDGLHLLKEHSTVGDLISFPVRKPPADIIRDRTRRLSESDVNDESPHPSRRQSLRRTSSVSSLLSLDKSRHPSESDTRDDAFESVADENVSKSDRRRLKRRQSMINAVRDELDKIPCLLALSGRREQEDSDAECPTDNEADERTQRARRSRRRSSVLSRVSFSSSDGTILTDSELKKIQMLNTLNKMDGKETFRQKRQQSIDGMGELSILEASFARPRRTSVSTHVLMKTRTRKQTLEEIKNSQNVDVLGKAEPLKRRESEILLEEKQARALKMFQTLVKKQESPRTERTKENSPTALFKGLKRRLRKRKVYTYSRDVNSLPFKKTAN